MKSVQPIKEKEKTKGYLILLKPSTQRKAKKKSIDLHKTFSEFVENLLICWNN